MGDISASTLFITSNLIGPDTRPTIITEIHISMDVTAAGAVYLRELAISSDRGGFPGLFAAISGVRAEIKWS